MLCLSLLSKNLLSNSSMYLRKSQWARMRKKVNLGMKLRLPQRFLSFFFNEVACPSKRGLRSEEKFPKMLILAFEVIQVHN